MSELTEKLSAYGVDVPLAMERFVGDEDMYLYCLELFISDKAFPELGYAIDAMDYKTAFEKAHSLKGVSANLGLQALYDSICEIVEPLRAADKNIPDINDLKAKYKTVLDSLEVVKTLVS